MPRFTQLTAPSKIEIKQRRPLTALPGETITQVQYAGTCGNDLPLFHGDYPAPLPHVCGHDFTESVKSVGESLDNKVDLKKGARRNQQHLHCLW